MTSTGIHVVPASALRPGLAPDSLETAWIVLRRFPALASVAILLLNDHVLKVAAPSWWTGKLSDVAGLFLFPVLLAVLISLPLRAAGRRDRWPGPVAFLVTGAWFALAKTSGGVHEATEALASALRGAPALVVRDPTDLIALAVLLPAWRHWESCARSRELGSTLRGVLTLGLGALACLATAPCPPADVITRLTVTDGSVYALSQPYEGFHVFYVSSDGGRQWAWLEETELPDGIRDALGPPMGLPATVCDVGRGLCVRIDGSQTVQQSRDAGETWTVAWTVPEARRSYMERVARRHGVPLGCGKTFEPSARDVVMLSEAGGPAALVAMGNEGLLRLTADGESSRHPIGSAVPTPFQAESLDQFWPPWTILTESLVALAVLPLVYGCLSLWLLTTLRGRTGSAPDSEASPMFRGKHAVLPGLLLLGFLWSLLSGFGLLGLPFLLAILILYASEVGWAWMVRHAAPPEAARRARNLARLAALASTLFVWGPFALWVQGAIGTYTLAFWLAIVAFGAVVGTSVYRLRRVIRDVGVG